MQSISNNKFCNSRTFDDGARVVQLEQEKSEASSEELLSRDRDFRDLIFI
jgi:hypothetical protein